MAKRNMRAITMVFKEVKVDEEGNPVFDKKTGEVLYKMTYRKVKHNAAYYPKGNNVKAENPTC